LKNAQIYTNFVKTSGLELFSVLFIGHKRENPTKKN
jgi:hypothetical protein